MEDNVHSGHRERLRAAVKSNGVMDLAEHNLLEYLLFYCIPYKDTNEIAHNLINKFGSFAGVLNAPVSELSAIKNMTENGALLLHNLPDVFRRYVNSTEREKPFLSNKTLIPYVANLLRYRSTECFYVFCLDNFSKLVNAVCLVNSDTKISFQIKDVVKAALNAGCYGVVIAHNHPSNNVLPSAPDVATTAKLSHTLSAMGIVFVDHLIVGNDKVYSFAAQKAFDINSDKLTVEEYTKLGFLPPKN